MNQIFHIRINWQHYLYLILLTTSAFFCLWHKTVIPAVIFLILIIVIIERILNTVYTITVSGTIVLHYGRFSPQQILFISEIEKIEKVEKMRIGSHALHSYLLVQLKNNPSNVSVIPIKEKEFIKRILAINPSILTNTEL